MRRVVIYLLKVCFRLAQQPILVLRKTKVSFTTTIGSHTTIANSLIGKYCYIGTGTIINQTITGNYCSIAPGVKIGGLEHSWWWCSTSLHLSDCCESNLKTLIEDDVWIGANAVIRKGVRICKGAVVASGAIVLRDVAPYTIVAGVPASPIKKRFQDDIILQVINTKYWQFPPKKAKKLLMKIKMQHLNRPPYLNRIDQGQEPT